MFDISPADKVGVFTVKAKVMGVDMEKVQVHIQVKNIEFDQLLNVLILSFGLDRFLLCLIQELCSKNFFTCFKFF